MTQPPGPAGPSEQPDGTTGPIEQVPPVPPGGGGQWLQAGPSQPAVAPPGGGDHPVWPVTPGQIPPGQVPSGQFPPGMPYPVPPGPPPAGSPRTKATSTRTKVLAGLVVAAIVGIGAFLVIRQEQTATVAADVGDCIRAEGTMTSSTPDTSQVPCTDPAALMVVTAVGDRSLTCGDYELSFEQEDAKGRVIDRLCLRPNVTVGQCYVEPVTLVDLPKVGPCGTLGSALELKVLVLDTTTADDDVCPEATVGAYTYPERSTVICFGRP